MGAYEPWSAHENPQKSAETRQSLMSLSEARQIVDQSVQGYFDSRREMVPDFIDRHFSWKGAWQLNKRALGRDLYRAPLNVALMAPALGVKVAARGLAKAGRNETAERLDRLQLHLKTDVNRELEWLIHTELLEIPFAQPSRGGEAPRSRQRDALADAIFAHPAMNAALENAVAGMVDAAGPRNRDELERLMFSYMETRAANAEVVNLALCLAAGGLIAHQVTPGAMSLAPTLAQTMAQSSAISHFPLGGALGQLWYRAFPIAPSAFLTAGTAVGVVGLASLVTAFSGILSDPVQRSLGLHERRLMLFLDTLEQNVLYEDSERLKVRDHYVGRIIDLFDAFAAVWAWAR